MLDGRYWLITREIVKVVQGLWELELSVGMVDKMCQQTSLALAPPYAEVQQHIPASSVTIILWHNLMLFSYWIWCHSIPQKL